MTEKNTIIPREYVEESVYRQVQNLQVIYKLTSFEQTINILVNFVTTDEELINLDKYMRKQFPSKF